MCSHLVETEWKKRRVQHNEQVVSRPVRADLGVEPRTKGSKLVVKPFGSVVTRSVNVMQVRHALPHRSPNLVQYGFR